MKYWFHIHNTPPEDGLALARHAQDPGFEGVVGDDHWFIRTGRIADGWMGMTAKLDELPGLIACINEGRREAGREREPFDFMVGLAPGESGILPDPEDDLRARDLGVTKGHFGPADHVLGKSATPLQEQKRLMDDFANRVIAKHS